MSYERKREKVKPDMYRVYNGSPVEVIMTIPTKSSQYVVKKRKALRVKTRLV